jgi:hypothetical protein
MSMKFVLNVSQQLINDPGPSVEYALKSERSRSGGRVRAKELIEGFGDQSLDTRAVSDSDVGERSHVLPMALHRRDRRRVIEGSERVQIPRRLGNTHILRREESIRCRRRGPAA